MVRGQFEQAFQGLPKRRREVLELFLARVKDEEIARILNIKEGTVRSHIRNSCDAFGLENLHEDDYSSRRGDLVELFKRYKPELVEEKEEEEERSQFDPNFVGREEAIADLNALIQNGAKCIQILSAGGQGKTTLAWQFLKTRFPNKDDILYFPIGKETKDIASIESLVEERLRQLGEEPGREFLVSLERLRERLTRQPMGVLIDNLEPALDESNRFVQQHRSYIELFKQVLLSPQVRSVTLITSRAPLQEGLAIQKYSLKPLSMEAWNQYFQHWKIVTDPTVLQAIYETYNGNALAMVVLCSAIQDEEDYKNNLAAYWADNKTDDGIYIEDPVLNLIREQFNSLEQLKPDTYKLLCRMGCFRYHDVPTVPEEGLFCLLWDVPKSQHKRVVKVLKDRALVDVFDGEYQLHPVVRLEALERLRDNREDWSKANRVAAEFWTKSVSNINSIENANSALEAYYHYLEIEDVISAIDVIAKERSHYHKSLEPLGSVLLSFGHLSKTKEIINRVKNSNNINYSLGRIYNILGDAYWMIGDLRNALLSHQESKKIALTLLSNSTATFLVPSIKIKKLYNASLFNYALCKIDYLEIPEAIKFLKLAQKTAEENNFHRYQLTTSFCLAFCYSYLRESEKAKSWIDQTQQISLSLLQEKHNSNIWTEGYLSLFIGKAHRNLGNFENAKFEYKNLLEFSEQINYPQLRANAIFRLAELYRIQSKFEEAINHHLESIQILEKIGAKCDLAEAYYQLALTYQAMNNPESKTHFNKALELWTEIDAPKQIKRVRYSMNNPPN